MDLNHGPRHYQWRALTSWAIRAFTLIKVNKKISKFQAKCDRISKKWAISSVGRARHSHWWGRRSESGMVHHIYFAKNWMPRPRLWLGLWQEHSRVNCIVFQIIFSTFRPVKCGSSRWFSRKFSFQINFIVARDFQLARTLIPASFSRLFVCFRLLVCGLGWPQKSNFSRVRAADFLFAQNRLIFLQDLFFVLQVRFSFR